MTVSWESPADPVTGYVIYYQTKGGPVISDMVSGGETETHSLDGLQRGVTYYISILALSQHLPSPLVGNRIAYLQKDSISKQHYTITTSGVYINLFCCLSMYRYDSGDHRKSGWCNGPHYHCTVNSHNDSSAAKGKNWPKEKVTTILSS